MEGKRIINYHLTRDFGTKVAVTFEFISQNFRPLMKCILYIVGPPMVVVGLFLGSFMDEFFSAAYVAGRTGRDNFLVETFLEPSYYLQAIIMYLALFVTLVTATATINNYIVLYEKKHSTEITPGEVWAAVRSTFWMYAGTVFLFFFIAFVVNLFALLFLGATSAISEDLSTMLSLFYAAIMIYLWNCASLTFFIRGYERKSFSAAISRSFSLVKGKWWSTFGLFAILTLIAWVISFIFFVPAYLVLIIAAMHTMDGQFNSTLKIPALFSVLMTVFYVISVLLQALPQIGLVFQYFNLVERKEALGLLRQIDSIGTPVPSSRELEEHY